MEKVVVRYNHQSDNFETIYLAVEDPERVDAYWHPALRDTIDGERVVWIYGTAPQGVWLKDSRGVKKVGDRQIVK